MKKALFFNPLLVFNFILTLASGAVFAQALAVGDLLSFEHIYEPSGLAYLGKGEFVIVEDEPVRPMHRVSIDENGRLQELGRLRIVGDEIRLNNLEGVSFDGVYLYAITSHSNISKTDEGKNRMQLVRFEYEDGLLSELQQVDDLKSVLVDLLSEQIKNKSSKKIRQKINIEALAWSPQAASLFIGLRSPRSHGNSAMLEILNPTAMFTQGSAIGARVQMHWLDLGGKGIRSMNWHADSRGFSIVTGGKKSRDEGFSLWYWSGELNSAATRVSEPDKPLPSGTEGLSLFATGSKSGMLVVLDDGNKSKSTPAHYQLFNFAPTQ